MKDDRVYLGHIRDAIHDIEQYTAAGRDAFMGDRMQQDAVIRKFEIIGEAVKHLSEHTTQRRPDIPWRRIAGMRDRLTHDYLGVDLSLVWAAVERELPNLRSAIGVTALRSVATRNEVLRLRMYSSVRSGTRTARLRF